MPLLIEKQFDSDHDFARWLKSKGWNGKHTHHGYSGSPLGTTDYLTDAGELLARTVVNNRTCTYRVLVREDLHE